ncbi:MAG: hypothetical protein AB7H77_03475 [Bdellovibrionales bacterium]
MKHQKSMDLLRGIVAEVMGGHVMRMEEHSVASVRTKPGMVDVNEKGNVEKLVYVALTCAAGAGLWFVGIKAGISAVNNFEVVRDYAVPLLGDKSMRNSIKIAARDFQKRIELKATMSEVGRLARYHSRNSTTRPAP